MSIFKIILVLSSSLFFENILANEFDCRKFVGDVQIQPAKHGRCPVLKKKDRRYPDVLFLQELGIPQSCFVGRLDGWLNDLPVYGRVASGLTTNRMEGAFLTAVSVITLFNGENNTKIGKIMTQDAIFDPEGDTREYLTMIRGTRSFNGGSGHIEILGNVFVGAPYTGQLCFGD